LGDRKGIWPVKTVAICPQRFSYGMGGGRKVRRFTLKRARRLNVYE